MSDDPLSEIAAAAENAQEAPDLRPAKPAANRADLDSFILPPDCPVKPMGHLKGKLFVLDVDGQWMEIDPKLPKEQIVYLFGRQLGWLEDNTSLCAWKNVGGNSEKNPPDFQPDGFDQRKVQIALTTACRDAGLLDISDKLRGRGSHRGEDGELILHCGNEILIGGRRGVRGQAKDSLWQEPGKIGDLIFPTGPALPHPAEKPAKAEAGHALLSILSLWNWKSTGKVDLGDAGSAPIEALLMLGWLGCAKLCGAIGWRPHVWLIGPSGAGKSTLQGLISRILARWALESQDPSEAWISQSLMDQRLPVLYDEPEPDEGTDGGGFVRKVIKLARLASQGSKRGRGSQDHKAVDFAIYSCFLFSSIMHHELDQQDRNRMAILSLSKFPPDTAAMNVDGIEKLLKPRFGLSGSLRDLGLALTRRLVEQWHRYEETRGVYQAELLRHRADQRMQDTYGELLALADMMLFDRAPGYQMDIGDPNPIEERDTRAARMVTALVPMLSIAEAEAENIAERCAARLTQYRLQAAGGKHPETVGRWLSRALVHMLLREDGSAEARDKLLGHGMKLVHVRLSPKTKEYGAYAAYCDPADDPVYVAVGNKNSEALRQIFNGTTWKGGEWQQALGMIAGALRAKVRFDGPDQRAVLVPIGELVDVEAARSEAARRRDELLRDRSS